MNGPLIAVAVLLVFGTPAYAEIITFASGNNQFDLEFVEIGSPGNVGDEMGQPRPAGSVPYTYYMGKFEVSRDMINKANAQAGLNIQMANMDARGGNRPDMPATGMSWYDAARFINWLNVERSYNEAYKFDGGTMQLWEAGDVGFDPANPYRNTGANFVLPSTNEWYKAAFFDPVTGTYFRYPTGSNTDPIGVASGTAAGTVVYQQSISQGPADIMLAGGLSPFGTMGQGANAAEWEETLWNSLSDTNILADGERHIRGAAWNSQFPHNVSSSEHNQQMPRNGLTGLGFRVGSLSGSAVVPEPSSVALMCVALVFFGVRKRVVRPRA